MVAAGFPSTIQVAWDVAFIVPGAVPKEHIADASLTTICAICSYLIRVPVSDCENPPSDSELLLLLHTVQDAEDVHFHL